MTSDVWLGLGGLLVFFSLPLQSPVLLVLGLSIIVVSVYAYYLKKVFHQLEIHVHAQESVCRVGEILSLNVTLNTPRKLSVLLQARWDLPKNLGQKGKKGDRQHVLMEWPNLEPGTTHTLHLQCMRRGRFMTGDIDLRITALFGLLVLERSLRLPTLSIWVYPQNIVVSNESPRSPVGSATSITPSIFTDPLRTSGLREYRHGDPLRLVHTRASMHYDRPMVKILETIAAKEVLLVWSLGDEPEETRETVAAVLANKASRLLRQGFAVGLVADALIGDGRLGVNLTPRTGVVQERRILKAIAAAERGYTWVHLDALVAHAQKQLPYGCPIWLFAPFPSLQVRRALRQLKHRGHPVLEMKEA